MTVYVLVIDVEGDTQTPELFHTRGEALDFVMDDLKKSPKKYSREELASIRDMLGSEGWWTDEDLCITYSIYESELK